jgi:hypothetical protein
MSMSTGAKVAIGCAIVAVGGAVVIAIALGFGAYWLKGKANKMTGGIEAMGRKAEEIQSWEQKANANAFTSPADGVISEDRLVKFLDVRRQIYAIYEQHQADFESFAARTKDKKDLTVSETLEGAGKLASLGADVRLAEMKGLAAVGMNEEEYRYIQMAVYKSAWASEAETGTGKMPSEALHEQAETLRAQAGESGSSPEAAQAAAAAAQMMESAEGSLAVPRANVELFRKHEADIKKYAMTGLAMIGL